MVPVVVVETREECQLDRIPNPRASFRTRVAMNLLHITSMYLIGVVKCPVVILVEGASGR